MKCPACGFETPGAQAWCDFCKEPFRRARKEEPARAEAAPAASTDPAPKLTPEQAFELLRADPGERIPSVSPSMRYAAYGFLFVCLLWGAAMTVMLMNRAQRLRAAAPTGTAAPEAAPVQNALAPAGDASLTR